MGIFTAALGFGLGFLLAPIGPWPLRVGGAIAVVAGSVLMLLAFQRPISRAIEWIDRKTSGPRARGRGASRSRGDNTGGVAAKLLGTLAGVLLGVGIGLLVGAIERPR